MIPNIKMEGAAEAEPLLLKEHVVSFTFHQGVLSSRSTHDTYMILCVNGYSEEPGGPAGF